ncbi:unnamed protein product [Bodo saltans]|uniref:Pyrrolo-quinoline quinone repeat domain-containing protein n=1 Tax=Bodo saltans TaxID=75058 RepID=A0A0S4J6I3_BODSA|nr:unnamed protein product [Bodo saltans]|eukprot:CUG43525.1 unnamed protein product [Bodo saltans]
MSRIVTALLCLLACTVCGLQRTIAPPTTLWALVGGGTVPAAPSLVAGSFGVTVELRTNSSGAAYLRGFNSTTGTQVWLREGAELCNALQFIDTFGDDVHFVAGCMDHFVIQTIASGAQAQVVSLPQGLQLSPLSSPVTADAYSAYAVATRKFFFFSGAGREPAAGPAACAAVVTCDGGCVLRIHCGDEEVCSAERGWRCRWERDERRGCVRRCARCADERVVCGDVPCVCECERCVRGGQRWDVCCVRPGAGVVRVAAVVQPRVAERVCERFAVHGGDVLVSSGASSTNLALGYYDSTGYYLVGYMGSTRSSPAWSAVLTELAEVVAGLGEMVFVMTRLHVMAFDGTTGARLWSTTGFVQLQPVIVVDPMLASNVFVFDQTYIYQLSSMTGAILTSVDPTFFTNPPLFPIAAPVRMLSLPYDSQVVITSAPQYVLAIGCTDGVLLWNCTAERCDDVVIELSLRSVLSPLVVVPVGSEKEQKGLLVQVADGLRVYSLDSGWMISGVTGAGAQENVLFVNDYSGVSAVDRNGFTLWSSPAPFSSFASSPTPFMSNIIFDIAGTSLVAINTYTGVVAQTVRMSTDCFSNSTLTPQIGAVVPDSTHSNAYFTAALPCLFRIGSDLSLHTIPLPLPAANGLVVDDDNGLAYFMTTHQLLAVSIPQGAATRVLFVSTSPIDIVLPSSSWSSAANLGKGLNTLIYVVTITQLVALDVTDAANKVVWGANIAVNAITYYNNFLYIVSTLNGVCKISLNVTAPMSERIVWCVGASVMEFVVEFALSVTPSGVLTALTNNGVYAVDAVTGRPRWSLSGSIQVSTAGNCEAMVLDSDHYILFVGCLDGAYRNLHNVSPCGALEPQVMEFVVEFALAVTPSGVLTALTNNGVYAVDAVTGRPRWSLSGSIQVSTAGNCEAMVLDSDHYILFVGCLDGAYALDVLQSGHVLYQVSAGGQGETLTYFNDVVFSVAENSVSGFPIPQAFRTRRGAYPTPIPTSDPTVETLPPGFAPVPLPEPTAGPYPSANAAGTYPSGFSTAAVGDFNDQVALGGGLVGTGRFRDVVFMTPRGTMDETIVLEAYNTTSNSVLWTTNIDESTQQVLGVTCTASFLCGATGVFLIFCNGYFLAFDALDGAALWNNTESQFSSAVMWSPATGGPHGDDCVLVVVSPGALLGMTASSGNQLFMITVDTETSSTMGTTRKASFPALSCGPRQPAAHTGDDCVLVVVSPGALLGMTASSGNQLFMITVDTETSSTMKLFVPTAGNDVAFVGMFGGVFQVIQIGPNRTQATMTVFVNPGGDSSFADRFCTQDSTIIAAGATLRNISDNVFGNSDYAYFACFHSDLTQNVALFRVNLLESAVTLVTNVSVGGSNILPSLNYMLVDALDEQSTAPQIYLTVSDYLYKIDAASGVIHWTASQQFGNGLGVSSDFVLAVVSDNTYSNTQPIGFFNKSTGEYLWNISIQQDLDLPQGQQAPPVRILTADVAPGYVVFALVGVFGISYGADGAEMIWAGAAASNAWIDTLQMTRSSTFISLAPSSVPVFEALVTMGNSQSTYFEKMLFTVQGEVPVPGSFGMPFLGSVSTITGTHSADGAEMIWAGAAASNAWIDTLQMTRSSTFISLAPSSVPVFEALVTMGNSQSTYFEKMLFTVQGEVPVPGSFGMPFLGSVSTITGNPFHVLITQNPELYASAPFAAIPEGWTALADVISFAETELPGTPSVPIAIVFSESYASFYHRASGQVLHEFFYVDSCSSSTGLSDEVSFIATYVIGSKLYFSDASCLYAVDLPNKKINALTLSTTGSLVVGETFVTSDNSTFITYSEAGAVWSVNIATMSVNWISDALQFVALESLIGLVLPAYAATVPVAQQQLFGYSTDGAVSFALGSGQVAWVRLLPVTEAAVVLPDGHLLLLTSGGAVKLNTSLALPPFSDRVIWEVAAGATTNPPASVADCTLVLPQSNVLVAAYVTDNIFALALETGDVLWNITFIGGDCTQLVTLPDPRAPAHLPPPYIGLPDGLGAMRVLTTESGEEVYRFGASMSSAPIAANGWLVTFTANTFMQQLPYPLPVQPVTSTVLPPAVVVPCSTVPINYVFPAADVNATTAALDSTGTPIGLMLWQTTPILPPNDVEVMSVYAVKGFVQGRDVIIQATVYQVYSSAIEGYATATQLGVLDALSGELLQSRTDVLCEGEELTHISSGLAVLVCQPSGPSNSGSQENLVLKFINTTTLELPVIASLESPDSDFLAGVLAQSVVIPDFHVMCLIGYFGYMPFCFGTDPSNHTTFATILYNVSCANQLAVAPVYDSVHQLLIYSCMATALGVQVPNFTNSVVAIHPATGDTVWQIDLELLQPTQLTIAGNYGVYLATNTMSALFIQCFFTATGEAVTPLLDDALPLVEANEIEQLLLVEKSSTPLDLRVVFLTNMRLAAYSTEAKSLAWDFNFTTSASTLTSAILILADPSQNGAQILYVGYFNGIEDVAVIFGVNPLLDGSLELMRRVVPNQFGMNSMLFTFIHELGATGLVINCGYTVVYFDLMAQSVSFVFPTGQSNAQDTFIYSKLTPTTGRTHLVLDFVNDIGSITQVLINSTNATFLLLQVIPVSLASSTSSREVLIGSVAGGSTFLFDSNGTLKWGTRTPISSTTNYGIFTPLLVDAGPNNRPIVINQFSPRGFYAFDADNGTLVYQGYLPLCVGGQGSEVVNGESQRAAVTADPTNGLVYFSVINSCLYALNTRTGAVMQGVVKGGVPLLAQLLTTAHT